MVFDQGGEFEREFLMALERRAIQSKGWSLCPVAELVCRDQEARWVSRGILWWWSTRWWTTRALQANNATVS